MTQHKHRTLTALMMFFVTIAMAWSETLPEVRGVWITTNMGLDWPGGETNATRQKTTLVRMLDRLKECNFNLVIFQIEANGDALWKSEIEPSMRAVTGDGSKSLNYDLCRFVVEECHRHDMECHAWIVPFRLGNAKNAVAYKRNPVVHPYYACADFSIDFEGTRYLDPGHPKTMKFLRKLYTEFLNNCPFDGISLDYTRYPGLQFNDSKTFVTYATKGMTKEEWRRDNINRVVAMIDSLSQAIRPGIIVGSAPIGTYRNVGNWKNATAYDSYQQDPAQWIAKGHHDLIIPQMYWGENRGFSDHLSTWVDVAGESATMVVGLAPYKMVDGSRWTADDVVELVTTARRTPGVAGVCFFRAEHVVGDNPKVKALYSRLKKIFVSPAPLPWH